MHYSMDYEIDIVSSQTVIMNMVEHQFDAASSAGEEVVLYSA